MAIYKLGDVINKIKSGSKAPSTNGAYDVYGSGGPFAKTNQFINKEEGILLPRKGTMQILWVPENI